MKSLLLIFIILGLASCANKESKIEEGEIASGEFLDDGTMESNEPEDEELLVDDKGDQENLALEEEYPSTSEQEMGNSTSSMSGEMGTYVAKNGETLMQVAFKIYGDYRKWKYLMDVNNLSDQSISEGTSLKYGKPMNDFVWNPKGNPYLIKTGDTLGHISQKKYNTTKKWRSIYENNKPLIRDPNLIFAGFTLYYIPDGSSTASN